MYLIIFNQTHWTSSLLLGNHSSWYICTFISLLFSSLRLLIFWKSNLHSHSIYAYIVCITYYALHHTLHKKLKTFANFWEKRHFCYCHFFSSPTHINPEHCLHTFSIHYDYFKNEKYFIASLSLSLSRFHTFRFVVSNLRNKLPYYLKWIFNGMCIS